MNKQKFNPKDFESKWRKKWAEKEIFKTPDINKNDDKYYVLDMYPYPSGSGLHVGHPRGYLGSDVIARMMRMKGKKVLHPMGFDSFGLPAENYAIKTGVHPQITTDKAIETFKEQIENMNLSYDWDRELAVHRPEYYKWTQWLFLQFYKKGWAYKKKAPVNWCPVDQTVLANEQVEDGKCERCGSEVVQKEMEQWFFKITEFADRLIEGLKDIDWPESTKLGQINWIGRKTGINITYNIEGQDESIVCFTTRPDTNFGATFIVCAPDSEFIKNNIEKLPNSKLVKEYALSTSKKTELERQQEGKTKTGVFTGWYAVNRLNNRSMPIYVSDFVLAGFGTGAVVGVPAHDMRDFEFAQAMDIEVIPVVKNPNIEKLKSYLMGNSGITVEDIESVGAKVIDKSDSGAFKIEIPKNSLEKYKALVREKMDVGFWNEVIGEDIWFCFKDKSGKVTEYILDWEKNREEISNKCSEFSKDEIEKTRNLYKYLADNEFYTDLLIQEEEGIMMNSDFLNGMDVHKATQKIMDYIEEKGWGEKVTTYRLRDWLLSRQRYWGAPIPIVYDPEGNPHEVAEDDLPLLLPTDVDFNPKGSSPLATSEQFKKRAVEKYGKGWHYEVDTMDTFVDSSWYFFRFTDVNNQKEFASKEKMNSWMPVDLYVGGAEHTVLHLMYARFFTKALHDLGYVDFEEPFLKLRHQGMILAEDNRKMSKRWGNTINPDDEIEKYGADTLRVYEMFMGPFNATMPWNTKTEIGVFRFLGKVWDLQSKVVTPLNLPSRGGNTPTLEREKGGVKAESPVYSKQVKEINKLIKKVTEDIESMSFNTAVAKMMEFVNLLQKEEKVSKEVWQKFLLVLAPFAPYITEELWSQLGNEFSIHKQEWPEYDETQVSEDEVTIGVQVNGKVRTTITISPEASEQEALDLAMADSKIQTYINGDPKKVIYVKGRILNIIV